MPLKNSATYYGPVTRFLHWSVFILFIWQYLSAAIMTHLARDQTLLALMQGDFYNWHKSIGLMLLVLALARLIWRK
ncbi:MAG TPA: cytochrome B, partial [Gammaproteobacteria bacterium]|nr:cytochrome B [Gammaproteobacteria bacterium]